MSPTTPVTVHVDEENAGALAVAAAVAVLRAAYPRQQFPDDSVRLYTTMLADMDGVAVAAAVKRLIRKTEWLPSIAEIRQEVAEEALGMPTPEQAWAQVVTALSDGQWAALTPNVRDVVRTMGGAWTFRHSENPGALRTQFMRYYEAERERALRGEAGALATTSLIQSATRKTLDALPETDAITARPVWARWLRRQQWMMPPVQDEFPEPTAEEKHDAILVLAEEWESDDYPTSAQVLRAEAQRIMDEASA